MGFHLTQHPVLMHKLAALRSKDTSPKVFRELMREVTFYLGYEATSHINVKEIEVEVRSLRGRGSATDAARAGGDRLFRVRSVNTASRARPPVHRRPSRARRATTLRSASPSSPSCAPASRWCAAGGARVPPRTASPAR